jgi:hypothetical protein
MFGSVTQGDVHAKLAEQGYAIEKKRVHLAGGHVKTLGKHEATIKLHPEISVEVSFEIVSENPIVEAPKAAEAPLGRDGKPRKPRREESGDTGHVQVERKSAVEMLLDSLGEAPAAAKPAAAGDDKANKGKKKKPKAGKGKKSDE